MRIFYFGCLNGPGHYLVDHNAKPISYYDNDLPWSNIDGDLCPDDTQKEGVVKIHCRDGWTAAAFWDNSIDHRPKSNSVLFVEDLIDISSVISEFKEHFPQIYKRFDFDLVEWLIPEEN